MLVASRGFSRPSKEEKSLRRAAYWGLFADLYRARVCLDGGADYNSCVSRALKDASTHVKRVDNAVGGDEAVFAKELTEISKELVKGEASQVRARLTAMLRKLIDDFAATTAPVLQPSYQLGASIFSEYCGSCHSASDETSPSLEGKLRYKPLPFTSPLRAASQSPFGIYGVMIHGVDQSEMASMLDVLSVDELWAVSFYVASLRYQTPSDQAAEEFSRRFAPVSREFALSNLAVATDHELRDQLAVLGFSCGECQAELAFLRAWWPWHGETKRLGEVAESPLKKAEFRALWMLALAIVVVSAGFIWVLRRRGRVE